MIVHLVNNVISVSLATEHLLIFKIGFIRLKTSISILVGVCQMHDFRIKYPSGCYPSWGMRKDLILHAIRLYIGIARFKGVSTKYLVNSLYWMKWLEYFKDDKETLEGKSMLLQTVSSQ